MDKYVAHGECNDCRYVGDMTFRRYAVEGRLTLTWSITVEAVCPECGCITNIDDMDEYPGGKPFIRKVTTERKYGGQE